MKVVIENVSKKYGTTEAVKDLSLEISDSEFLVLLGPSGCGKTTTLRMIAGLETVDSGNIYIGDTCVNDLEPRERDVAMVFQNYALYPHMNVYNNITFDLRVRKVPKKEITRRVEIAAEMLGIGHLLYRKPSQLSGGEAQRVALGRAIVREPRVFLMDEPLSNLDAKLRVQMRAELQRLHRRLKITTIYVTHDQEEAMTIGQRIAIMNHGVLQQAGRPNEVYGRPANLFIGGFIGSPSMNMFEGSIARKESKVVIDVGLFTYDLPEGIDAIVKDMLVSSGIVLGIRPEHVTIAGEKDWRHLSLKAVVDVIEPVGREIHVQLKANDHILTVIIDPDKKLKIEEEVWLTVDRRKIHVFDKSTGKCIEMPEF